MLELGNNRERLLTIETVTRCPWDLSSHVLLYSSGITKKAVLAVDIMGEVLI